MIWDVWKCKAFRPFMLPLWDSHHLAQPLQPALVLWLVRIGWKQRAKYVISSEPQEFIFESVSVRPVA